MRYTWKCKKCGHTEIVDAKIVDRDIAPVVPGECEHEFVRAVEGGTFILQGTGWFKSGGY